MDTKAEFHAKFEALKQQFRARCRARSEALDQAIEAGDVAAVKLTAHQIAGSAGLYGFGDLANHAHCISSGDLTRTEELMTAARALSESLKGVADKD